MDSMFVLRMEHVLPHSSYGVHVEFAKHALNLCLQVQMYSLNTTCLYTCRLYTHVCTCCTVKIQWCVVLCFKVDSVTRPMGCGYLARFLLAGRAGAGGLLDGSRRLFHVSAKFFVSFTAQFVSWASLHKFVYTLSCYMYRYFREVDVCRYQPNWHCERVKTVLHPYAPARLRLIAFQTYVPTQVDVCAYQPSYRYRNISYVVLPTGMAMRWSHPKFNDLCIPHVSCVN